jgi:hypothetical protein
LHRSTRGRPVCVISGPPQFWSNRDAGRNPLTYAVSSSLAAVSRVGLHFAGERLQVRKLRGCRNRHVVIGVTRANEIDKTNVPGASRQSEECHRWARLRFRLAVPHGLGPGEPYPYSSPVPVFYRIKASLIPEEVWACPHRNGRCIIDSVGLHVALIDIKQTFTRLEKWRDNRHSPARLKVDVGSTCGR